MIVSRVCSSSTRRPPGASHARCEASSGPRWRISSSAPRTRSVASASVPTYPAIPHIALQLLDENADFARPELLAPPAVGLDRVVVEVGREAADEPPRIAEAVG